VKEKVKLEELIIKTAKTLIIWIVIFLGFRYIFPARFNNALSMSMRYAKEMVMIFPAVLIIMGLADIWVPTDLVKQYLGTKSGLRGKFLAIFLGTLPTGPMYIAFPIDAELLRKKASLSNIIIFLGVWASLKIPQLGIEIQFIGLKFSALRFIFTLISIIIIALIMEKIIDVEELEI
jgi:uncharacterized membrane protein YraQ (UPF0718 family)